MNNTTKTILIILRIILIVCACGVPIVLGTGVWSMVEIVQWADQDTTEDPAEVAQVASGLPCMMSRKASRPSSVCSWATSTVEEVKYNVDVSEYIRQKGP